AMGWGIALIYVGRQVAGRCSSAQPLTSALGRTDGADAIAKCGREGFPQSTVVFLDVEHMDVIPDGVKGYVFGWFQAVAVSRFVPGMYRHARNAVELKAAATQAYPAGKPAPLFWVAGGPKSFDPAKSMPADSGVSFAAVWQGRLDTNDSHGGITLQIDEDVAG